MVKIIVGHYYRFSQFPPKTVKEIKDSFTKYVVQKCIKLDGRWIDFEECTGWNWADEQKDELLDVTYLMEKARKKDNLPDYDFNDFNDVNF